MRSITFDKPIRGWRIYLTVPTLLDGWNDIDQILIYERTDSKAAVECTKRGTWSYWITSWKPAKIGCGVVTFSKKCGNGYPSAEAAMHACDLRIARDESKRRG